MTTLARKLRGVDYFTLAWGTMVGVGWLVVMDDWLVRGGVLGAILGFAIGGALLFPIGYVYGRLVLALPDAAGEVAYTAQVFPESVSFVTGWMMVLSYFIVCPWEAVAVGKIASYIFPALDSLVLYRIQGRPVYLPHVLIGLGLVALLTVLNYRGIRSSASFQNWATFGTLALFVSFVGLGVSKGSMRNFPPLFTHGGFVSVLLVVQIVPYFMAGYESVVKGAEEASPDFNVRGFSKAIGMAIAVGILFYTVVIAAVGYVAPWRQLTEQKFMTAVAFEQAVGSRWIVGIILATALLSLVKIFNGNFVAASRLLFAMARRGMVDTTLARIHARNHTPSDAVIWVGVSTAACMFLGDAILVPVTEVGSVASAAGWLAACAAYYQMRPSPGQRSAAILGGLVALSLVLMKVVPFVPGHLSRYEWLALGLWSLLGVALKRSRRAARTLSGEAAR
ncbi:MAG TPA: APC family permease [Terriglobales bacterium]|nr:APC family permease [Terriglobales bacterium]